MKITGILVIGLLLTASLHAQVSTSQPALIDVADKAAVDAHLGQDVFIQGVVSKAEWSRTGTVLNIDFKNAEKSRVFAVLFQRNRLKIDEAFLGDVAKTITGAKVRIHGMLELYDGPSPAIKGRPQIIINIGSQITILEPVKP